MSRKKTEAVDDASCDCCEDLDDGKNPLLVSVLDGQKQTIVEFDITYGQSKVILWWFTGCAKHRNCQECPIRTTDCATLRRKFWPTGEPRIKV